MSEVLEKARLLKQYSVQDGGLQDVTCCQDLTPMIKRRHFLQFAASTLASLGVSTLHLQRQSIRYGNVLAQPTQRKRALLVGINEYKGRLRSLLKR